MSITGSSTEISTTWTEQTIVSFNAGSLASIDEMIDYIESKLHRGTLSSSTVPTLSTAQTEIARAKQEITELKNFTWRRRFAYCTLSSGDYRIALPPDYNGGEIVVKDTTNDRELVPWSPHAYDSKFPDPSEETSDEPIVYTIKNLEMWIVPPSSGSYQLEMEYGRSGADNTTTDVSWLPEIERFRCCDIALARLFDGLHNPMMADRYWQRVGEDHQRARRADGKRKWGRHNYQVVSWLQVSAARRYQQDPEL